MNLENCCALKLCEATQFPRESASRFMIDCQPALRCYGLQSFWGARLVQVQFVRRTCEMNSWSGLRTGSGHLDDSDYSYSYDTRTVLVLDTRRRTRSARKPRSEVCARRIRTMALKLVSFACTMLACMLAA
eukprot:scaffold43270_cov54-Prasinocladus_malaysianus.AAC.1